MKLTTAILLNALLVVNATAQTHSQFQDDAARLEAAKLQRQQEIEYRRNLQQRIDTLQEQFKRGEASFDAVQRECEPASAKSSNDGSTDEDFKELLGAVRKGDSARAGRLANSLLSYHLQSVTLEQKVCALVASNFASAENQRVASQPENRLKNVYKAYIAMQGCYEARRAFKVQYVTKQELEAARSITRRDEGKVLQEYPQLRKQKDALWEQAKQEYGASDFATILRVNGTSHSKIADQHCKLVAMGFNSDNGYQQQQIKKDF